MKHNKSSTITPATKASTFNATPALRKESMGAVMETKEKEAAGAPVGYLPSVDSLADKSTSKHSVGADRSEGMMHN